jgi:hypothetical protein
MANRKHRLSGQSIGELTGLVPWDKTTTHLTPGAPGLRADKGRRRATKDSMGSGGNVLHIMA